MSLVVSLGKFLKCIFNLSLSLCPLLSISHLSLFGSLSLPLSSHLTCQCVNVTLRGGNIRETIWRVIEKKKEETSNLFISHQKNSLSLRYTVIYLYL